MLDIETRLALEDDVPAVREFIEEHDGGVTVDQCDPAVYWLSLHPRSTPDETYFVRLVWSQYPHAAPSVLFASGVAGELGQARFWPVIPGYRPPNDICMPFTSEGFALHAEWATGPHAWIMNGNPFLRVTQQLQDDLDNRYSGRAG